jgi:dihydrofolate reductase
MRKLVESTFITIDGVIGSPEKWGMPYWDDEHNAKAHDMLFAADSLLLGRETYQGFAQWWPQAESDAYSDRINALPKHVASTTLTELTWNATLLGPDIAAEVAKLKEQPGGDILKYGTGRLDLTLIRNNLVDEFHFWVFPVIAGSGQRLLDGIDVTHLNLVDQSTFKSGITVLVYQPK